MPEWVDGTVPQEMREGLDEGAMQELGVKTEASEGLVKMTFARPAHIPPANPQAMPPGYEHQAANATPGGGRVLTYDFPLLPGVQCHVALVGEATADHLEQLADYIAVAVKRLRQQEVRDAAIALKEGRNVPKGKKQPLVPEVVE